MTAKNVKPTETPDVEGKTAPQSPRRQTVAGSISAEAYEALETYRWENRLSKAQVLERAVTEFLAGVKSV